MSRIAFIGLGNMGGGMAARQTGAGHAVAAFDLSAPALERARAAGCTTPASAAEAVADADVVLTMLPAGSHVRQVFAESVIPAAKAGALLIDCSTIDVESAREVGRQARDKGLAFADAPVSGGIAAAEGGTLAFMVGCETDVFPRVQAALAPMAKAVVHAGEVGAGQAAKICNNMVLGVSMIGVCEAFALAEKLGLKADNFFDIASQASAQCWSITSYCPWPGVGPAAPSDRGYEGGFLTKLMLKDLKLAQAAAEASGADTPLGRHAAEIYDDFAADGYGDKDFSAVLQLFRGHLDELNAEVRGGR